MSRNGRASEILVRKCVLVNIVYPKCYNGCERDCSSASDKVVGGNKQNDFTVHLANLTVVSHKMDERKKFSFLGVCPKQIVTVSKETDHERAIKLREGISRMILLYV